MFTRRSVVALSAAIPFARQPLRLDLEDTRIDALNSGDAEIFSIAPDGSTFVMLHDWEWLSFFSIAENMILGESDPLPELGGMDWQSVRWSPDGTRIAFSLTAWTLGRDSDIFIADVATGEITNLTAEGHKFEADSVLQMPDVQIDLFPEWIDDDTLLFARHTELSSDSPVVDLIKMSVSGGSPETVAELAPHDVQFVNRPFHRTNDGRRVLDVTMFDDGAQTLRVAIVGNDGSVEPLDVGEVRAPQLLDANDTHCLVMDLAKSDIHVVPYDSGENVVSIQDKFPLPDDVVNVSNPVFGPDPDSLIMVTSNAEKIESVILHDGTDITKLAELKGNVRGGATCIMLDDHVAVQSRTNWWLVPLE